MKTTPQSLAIALVTLVGAPLFGCSSEAKSSETNQGGGAAGSASGGTGGGGAGGAGGADDPEPTYCEALGLGEWAFDATAELVSTINALAADFTIETVGGAFTLSEAWTGCDNYVFVPQTPAMVEDHGIDIWASADDMDAVFAALPRNTQIGRASCRERV